MRWSLFPKLFREDSPEALATRVRQAGLDTVKVVVRDGYWVDPNHLRTSLPRFLKAMEREGVESDVASTTYGPDELLGVDGPLPSFAENGIREFRMGWFPLPDRDVQIAMDEAREDMARVAQACANHGVRAIYQLHHRTLVSSPSAAFRLIDGLDPEFVGLELDPGNQRFEGFEAWSYACDLLRPYLRWVAVKDAARIDGRLQFVPVREGETDWCELAMQLAKIDFDGDFVMMPFYDDRPSETWQSLLEDDVDFARSVFSRRPESARG